VPPIASAKRTEKARPFEVLVARHQRKDLAICAARQRAVRQDAKIIINSSAFRRPSPPAKPNLKAILLFDMVNCGLQQRAQCCKRKSVVGWRSVDRANLTRCGNPKLRLRSLIPAPNLRNYFASHSRWKRMPCLCLAHGLADKTRRAIEWR